MSFDINRNIRNIIKSYLLPEKLMIYKNKQVCLNQLLLKTNSIRFILDWFKNDNNIGSYHLYKNIYWTFKLIFKI